MSEMDEAERTARNRYFLIVLANMACVAGAVFGLLLIGRSVDTAPRVLGAAILLTGLYCMAIIPKALARRWRSPRE